MNISFHRPISPLSLDELMNDSIKNGWLTTGPNVENFESLLSDYLGVKNVVALNSCTASLHLALKANNFLPGDKFIVPTYTFVASVEVGEYLGMKPLLVDCDEDFNLDLNQVSKILKTEKNVKAIIPVHFAGKPVDMEKLKIIVKDYNLFIIEDAAHALETYSNIGKVGKTSHAVAFSFYANKNITTFGEGGALATDDDAFAKKIRKLSLHGMSKDGWKRFKIGNKWQYDVSELGYKYNMTEIASSYGIWQMGFLEKWYNRRTFIFEKYCHNLKKIDGILCPLDSTNPEKNGYHLFIIKIIPKMWRIKRDELIELINKKGIGTSVHYKPIHMHSYYKKKYSYSDKDFPNSELFYKTVISLPFYPALKDDELDYIINTIHELWLKYKN